MTMREGSGASIAICGGSGLYALAGLEGVETRHVETPFGEPSDAIRLGTLGGHRVAFLARHGPDHRLLPSEINYRANVFALKTLGVSRIISASAVGSMRERIRPRDVVLSDQFIDRAPHREATFFGDGIAAHVSVARPVCGELRDVLRGALGATDATVHDGGTYLCMEGPAFSTLAESKLYRGWGVDVIGMTNAHEAKLAREAEICYATMAFVTDYDCWHDDEADVTVGGVVANLKANAQVAAKAVRRAVELLDDGPRHCDCANALRDAIITPLSAVPEETRRRLRPILGRYLASS